MPVAFQFTLYSGQLLREAHVFAKLWGLLQDPLVQAARFDMNERTKHTFTADPEPARRLLRSRSLFVKGRRDGFVLFAHEYGDGLATLDVYLKYKTWNPEWLAWIERVASELPILFGFGATKDEHDRKHKTIRLSSDGLGHSEGAVGMSIPEFYQYLPGIYWVTLFGPELSESLDLERAATIAGVSVRAFDARQRIIAVDGPPETSDLEGRSATERAIAAAIGDDYFFDRDRTDRTLRAVPSLADALARLKEPS